ncbi:MAG: AlpA family transcriptional regulator [Oceanospirillaceae bacterium]|uniref:helix-turn-helix transcriptional regulator n=1 Tax=unclassified Thalassolituus TaxID=2624967 RepID=UPI000C3DAD61|nr:MULTISPECIES: AlpA family phage regulatory protein [unclassified Thalassolituus]MBS54982.1 AlpA family transcriptional regulator [Oceanospirillaceae bacterium]|tara:strand:+ start:207 stop:431 length:225 start_codon:yes stop_codon:yes gene_type:complete
MTKHTPTSPYEIWRRPQVEKVTGLSRNSIHRRIDDNLFPKPISLGGRSIGWRSIDVMAWLDQQSAAAGYDVECK